MPEGDDHFINLTSFKKNCEQGTPILEEGTMKKILQALHSDTSNLIGGLAECPNPCD
jgi:hypothetical protein